MNGNGNGATTLAYLRGTKDLFEEGEQLEEKSEVLGLSEAQKRGVKRFWKVASLLQKNSRMSLTQMAKKLKIPVSTAFDTLKEVEKHFHFTIVLKEKEKDVPGTDTTPLEFGYNVIIDTGAEKKHPASRVGR